MTISYSAILALRTIENSVAIYSIVLYFWTGLISSHQRTRLTTKTKKAWDKHKETAGPLPDRQLAGNTSLMYARTIMNSIFAQTLSASRPPTSSSLTGMFPIPVYAHT
jgi:uncharacterized membrane protein